MLLGTTLGTTFRMMLGTALAPLIPPSWGKRCKTHPRSSRGGGKAGSSQRGVRAQRALLEGGGQPSPGSAWLQLSPKIISPAAVFFAGLGNFIFIFRAISWRGPTPGLCTAAVLGYSAPGAAELQFGLVLLLSPISLRQICQIQKGWRWSTALLAQHYEFLHRACCGTSTAAAYPAIARRQLCNKIPLGYDKLVKLSALRQTICPNLLQAPHAL